MPNDLRELLGFESMELVPLPASARRSVFEAPDVVPGEEHRTGPQEEIRGRKVLDYPWTDQEEDNWCWAAVALSMDECYERQSGGSTDWSLCRIVEAELRRDDCCANGSTDDCDRVWRLDFALRRVRRLKRLWMRRASFRTTAGLIDRDEPLGLRIGWFAGGGHFVAIYGYDREAGTVNISDPKSGETIHYHRTFPRDYNGGGRWTFTCTTRA